MRQLLTEGNPCSSTSWNRGMYRDIDKLIERDRRKDGESVQ